MNTWHVRVHLYFSLCDVHSCRRGHSGRAGLSDYCRLLSISLRSQGLFTAREACTGTSKSSYECDTCHSSRSVAGFRVCRSPLSMPTLTAYTFFSEATSEELKQAGRTRVSAIELAERWRALSDAARRPWDEKASTAQEAFLAERTQHYVEAGDGEAGEEEGEEDAKDEAEEDEEGDDDESLESDGVRVSASTMLPFSRVKRIAGEHVEYGNVGKEATFTASKV